PTDWSGDSRSVLFMSNQNGSQHVFIQDRDSDSARMLTAGPLWHTWPRYEPGGSILFWQFPAGEESIPVRAELMWLDNRVPPPVHVLSARRPALMKLNGRQPPRNVQFRCPRNAGPCVLGEIEGEELIFSSFDPKNGKPTELIRLPTNDQPYVSDWDLSPDGK